MTQKQVAHELEMSISKLRRIEQGTSVINRRDLDALLMLYGVSDPADRKEAHASRLMAKYAPTVEDDGIHPRDFRDFVELEQHAARIRWYEPLLLPGLLQTRETARALALVTGPRHLREDDTIVERRVDFRMARQRLLHRSDSPTTHFILDEAAVCRPIGTATVFAGQLRHLLTLASLSHVAIQVIPFAVGEHPGLVGNFEIVDFSDPDDDSLLYVEGARRGKGNLQAPHGTMESPEEIAYYIMLFDTLADVALSADETLALIERRLHEVTDERTGPVAPGLS